MIENNISAYIIVIAWILVSIAIISPLLGESSKGEKAYLIWIVFASTILLLKNLQLI